MQVTKLLVLLDICHSTVWLQERWRELPGQLADGSPSAITRGLPPEASVELAGLVIVGPGHGVGTEVPDDVEDAGLAAAATAAAGGTPAAALAAGPVCGINWTGTARAVAVRQSS